MALVEKAARDTAETALARVAQAEYESIGP